MFTPRGSVGEEENRNKRYTEHRDRQKNREMEPENGEQFACLFVFYGTSTFVGYFMPNPFNINNQFYFKQFSLAWVHSLIVKNISISSYSV